MSARARSPAVPAPPHSHLLFPPSSFQFPMSASSRAAPSPAPDSSSLHSASSAGSLDVVLSHSSRRAASFELQIKALEEKLSEDLSNCRAIESTLREAFNGIKRNYRRADKDALRQHVPHIDAELDRARGVLGELEARLPEIRTEAAQVRRAYDSGRDKAQLLVEDLRWLNRDFTSRWRTVVFTRTSPVSWRVRAMLRTLFVLALVLAAWGAWLALRGVYRAHRQRLVWGERLIS